MTENRLRIETTPQEREDDYAEAYVFELDADGSLTISEEHDGDLGDGGISIPGRIWRRAFNELIGFYLDDDPD